MKHFISIRYILTLLIVSPLIAATVATAILGYLSGSKAVNYLALKFSNKAIIYIEKHIDSYLIIPAIINKINGIIVENDLLDPNEFESLGHYFKEKLKVINSLNYIYFGDRNGDFIGVKKRSDGQMVLLLRDATNAPRLEMYQMTAQGEPGERIETLETQYDSRNLPWYKKAIDFKEVTWSPIQISASTLEPEITSTMPIYDSSESDKPENAIGVFGINLSLEHLSYFLKELDICPKRDAFIIDRTGHLIASSTDEKLFFSENGKYQQLLAMDSQKLTIQVTMKHLLETQSSLMPIQDLTALEYTLENQRHLVQVAPLQSHGLDWLVFVVIPEQDFMELIYTNLRFTFIVGLGITIIAIILGGITSVWIIKPIGDLNTCAKAIKSNTLDVNILQKIASRPDEIGELGQTFLEMAEIVNAREKSMSDKLDELRTQNQQWRRTVQQKQDLRMEHFNNVLDQARKTRKYPEKR